MSTLTQSPSSMTPHARVSPPVDFISPWAGAALIALALGVGPGQLALAGVDDGYGVEVIQAPGDVTTGWSIGKDGTAVGWTRVGGNDQGFVAFDESGQAVGLLAGTSRSDVVAINSQGIAVGNSGLTSETRRGFTWTEGGGMEALPLGRGGQSTVSSINDLGQVGGTTWGNDGRRQAAIWTEAGEGDLILLGDFGGSANSIRWISPDGRTAVGSSQFPDSSISYGVMWDVEEGAPPSLLPPEDQVNVPYFIHENGNIAGFARYDDVGDGNARGTIWREGEVALRLGTLADGSGEAPFASSTATAVNSAGQIVGMSINAAGSNVVYIYHRGEMYDLSDLLPEGWNVTSIGPGALNERGEIVVRGSMPGGSPVALRLIPNVPLCPGDLNGDDQVNRTDLSLARQDQGCAGGLEACSGDANFDGETNREDINIVLAALRGGCPS